MAKHTKGWRFLPLPPDLVEVGDPFNGVMERAPFDSPVPDSRDPLIFHPGIGWATLPYGPVERGKGMAIWGGCGLRAFITHDLDRTTGCKLLHMSVKFPNREPTWSEMNALRDAFFPHDVDVIQVHPKHENYVNIAKWVWHLWQFPGEWDPSGV